MDQYIFYGRRMHTKSRDNSNTPTYGFETPFSFPGVVCLADLQDSFPQKADGLSENQPAQWFLCSRFSRFDRGIFRHGCVLHLGCVHF